MTTVVIVIHLMVVLAMIGLILLQRSEGGALGIGGGQGAFMTGRSAGNVLSHTTAYLAIAFFVTSLGLAFIAKYQSRPSDILERLPGADRAGHDRDARRLRADGSADERRGSAEAARRHSGGPQTPPATDGSAPANGAAPRARHSGASRRPRRPLRPRPKARARTRAGPQSAPAPQTPPATASKSPPRRAWPSERATASANSRWFSSRAATMNSFQLRLTKGRPRNSIFRAISLGEGIHAMHKDRGRHSVSGCRFMVGERRGRACH